MNKVSLAGAVALAFAPALAFAAPPDHSQAVKAGLAHFNASKGRHGLSNPSAELKAREGSISDERQTHVRFDQFHKGVRVFEGEAIAHVSDAGKVSVTSALRAGLAIDTRPSVAQADAVRAAVDDIGPAGAHSVERADLVILPQGERSEVTRLAWHVTVFVGNREDGTFQRDYFVDAHSGYVAWSFDSLETSAATGTAKTMFLGDKPVATDFASGTYSLKDLTRGGGNYTCDKKGKTNAPQCTAFSSTNNVFGNNVKDSSNRATAGADAQYGMEKSWDYFKLVHGRNGIDNTGRKAYSRVHYGTNYQNAFWSDSCFCMTYGDGGTSFYPLISIDVAGHEMAHGVTSTSANLTYAGESGGLNEANSDMFGTMIEYYINDTNDGNANRDDTPDYWIGERIYKSNWSTGNFVQTKALRYMDDPGKDGSSPACWSSGLGSLDVHYSSGPANHMFYLLAEGGTSKCNGAAVAGITRAKAEKIWYRALTAYMTSSTNYAGARTAALNAAAAIYGAGSAEQNGVAAAFSAINVN